MNIVQVVHGLPPQERAGVEILTLELSRALQARGHQVTIIARTAAPECAKSSACTKSRTSRGCGSSALSITIPGRRPFASTTIIPFLMMPFASSWIGVGLISCIFSTFSTSRPASFPACPASAIPRCWVCMTFFSPVTWCSSLIRADRLCPGPQRGERCVACLHDLASADAARHRFSGLWTRVLHGSRSGWSRRRSFWPGGLTDEFPFLHDRLQVIPYGLPLPPGAVQDRPARSKTSDDSVGHVGSVTVAEDSPCGLCMWASCCPTRARTC